VTEVLFFRSIFLLFAGFGFLYFSFRKSQFDLLAVGFFGSLVYFVPGFVGIDASNSQLAWQLYATFSLVLLMIIGVAVLKAGLMNQTPFSSSDTSAERLPFAICGLLALGSFVSIVALLGVGELLKPKGEMQIATTQSVLWRVGASLALVGAVMTKFRLMLWLSAVLVLAMTIASDRTAIGMVAVAISWWYFRCKGPARWLPNNINVIALLLCVGMVIVLGKLVHATVIALASGAPVELVAEYAIETGLFGLLAKSEPFGIQLVFNRIVQSNFSADPSYLLGAFAQVFPVPSVFGVESTHFNDLFQFSLFPEFPQRSMAYNFWAEAYANGGGLFVLGFSCLYVLGLVLFDLLARSRSALLMTIGLLGGAYWAFYLHRNSLLSILAYERQILYVGLLVAFSCFTIRLVSPQRAPLNS
jgi:hypothetical protein